MRQWTIDAFAGEPFKGNPACVVEPFDTWPDPAWMQALAAENNQAETAFLLKTAEPARFGLRWFTPTLEVNLCGHATLASGHALFAELELAASAITFDTQSGPLIVTRTPTGYEMDFPADPPQRVESPEGLEAAIGTKPLEAWAGQYLVAVLESDAVVRDLAPDLGAIKSLKTGARSEWGAVAVAALATSGGPYDVVSRFFAPGAGIDEDPATGSLHCILSPLFSAKLGRTILRFHQAYPGRGGDLECEDVGDRVRLRGQAVTVVEARLRLKGWMTSLDV